MVLPLPAGGDDPANMICSETTENTATSPAPRHLESSEQVVKRDLAAGIGHLRVANLPNSGLLRATGALN
jgi:hypothetical protein